MVKDIDLSKLILNLYYDDEDYYKGYYYDEFDYKYEEYEYIKLNKLFDED